MHKIVQITSNYNAYYRLLPYKSNPLPYNNFTLEIYCVTWLQYDFWGSFHVTSAEVNNLKWQLYYIKPESM